MVNHHPLRPHTVNNCQLNWSQMAKPICLGCIAYTRSFSLSCLDILCSMCSLWAKKSYIAVLHLHSWRYFFQLPFCVVCFQGVDGICIVCFPTRGNTLVNDCFFALFQVWPWLVLVSNLVLFLTFLCLFVHWQHLHCMQEGVWTWPWHANGVVSLAGDTWQHHIGDAMNHCPDTYWYHTTTQWYAIFIFCAIVRLLMRVMLGYSKDTSYLPSPFL